MEIDFTAFSLIANSLAKRFLSMYYVEIEGGLFKEFIHSDYFAAMGAKKEGKDFFFMALKDARKFLHPDDLQNFIKNRDKETVLKNLEKNDVYSISSRLVFNGKIVNVRFTDIMCDDKKHILSGVENIDDEIKAKLEHERNLLSAERMARRDELTDVKNKNAFAEYSQAIDGKIKKGAHDFNFALLMCDLNDLKHINDTRGHSFGDEVLLKASRMICDAFKHSPVFRIGGDEFASVLTDYDFEQRERLLESLRKESDENGRDRSGPQLASGLATYNPALDASFADVFNRADHEMYENKKLIKSRKDVEAFKKMDNIETPITADRKRILDGLFGALYTVAGGGYIYLDDMRHDYSRWSLPLLDDFGIKTEYMYHADRVWRKYIHPEDLKAYNEVIKALFNGSADLIPIVYRARKRDGNYVLLATRCFVLNDSDGKPEYFGGIIVPQ